MDFGTVIIWLGVIWVCRRMAKKPENCDPIENCDPTANRTVTGNNTISVSDVVEEIEEGIGQQRKKRDWVFILYMSTAMLVWGWILSRDSNNPHWREPTKTTKHAEIFVLPVAEPHSWLIKANSWRKTVTSTWQDLKAEASEYATTDIISILFSESGAVDRDYDEREDPSREPIPSRKISKPKSREQIYLEEEKRREMELNIEKSRRHRHKASHSDSKNKREDEAARRAEERVSKEREIKAVNQAKDGRAQKRAAQKVELDAGIESEVKALVARCRGKDGPVKVEVDFFDFGSLYSNSGDEKDVPSCDILVRCY